MILGRKNLFYWQNLSLQMNGRQNQFLRSPSGVAGHKPSTELRWGRVKLVRLVAVMDLYYKNLSQKKKLSR